MASSNKVENVVENMLMLKQRTDKQNRKQRLEPIKENKISSVSALRLCCLPPTRGLIDTVLLHLSEDGIVWECKYRLYQRNISLSPGKHFHPIYCAASRQNELLAKSKKIFWQKNKRCLITLNIQQSPVGN